MSRIGFDYYPADTDRHQDIKIKRLKRKFGPAGFAIYDYILAEIYRDKGCYLQWGDDILFDTAEYWEVDESKVKEIVNYCCEVELFNQKLFQNSGILSSRSIITRFKEIARRLKRKSRNVPEFLAELTEESVKLPEETLKHPEVLRQGKERKRKERELKEKKGKENNFISPGENYFNVGDTVVRNVLGFIQKEFPIQINNWQKLYPLANTNQCADEFMLKNTFETFENNQHFKNAFLKFMQSDHKNNEIKKSKNQELIQDGPKKLSYAIKK